jgi:hypothetical protein
VRSGKEDMSSDDERIEGVEGVDEEEGDGVGVVEKTSACLEK